MRYLSLTDADREAMLAEIGVDSIDELFRDIPEGVRFGGRLDLEPPLAEQELVAHLNELAERNVPAGEELSFLGAGIYDHYVPAVVDSVLAQGQLLTAYTPYQPELSQGVLQAIFEYQTAICELTGMDVSNASGYDGTTVAADACYVAKHATGRSKVVLCETLNPQVRQVVKTYAPGFGLEVVEVPHRDGTTDPDELGEAARDAACVIFQQPNFFGCLEPAPDLAAAANEAEALPIAHVDPVSLGVLEAPGQVRLRAGDRRGAGRGQPPGLRRPALWIFGSPPGVHPPHAGADHRRDDRRRGRAGVRAHAPDTRAAHSPGEGDVEHHHESDAACDRRPRLPDVARPTRAARAGGALHRPRRATRRSASGSRLCFRIRQRSRSLPSASDGRPTRSSRTAREHGVNPGYPLRRDYPGLEDALLVCVTEKRTPAEIDRLAEVLAEVTA